ncbi:DUF2637 domain-containing protein [Streptomyces canus]|uniref:DUF2637 domain-containing protein n=1 Tax=Streptomyces canus TaxID=58343 RepID=UPI002780B4C4|nr:DUF2637 domain-containing protein [Streptomyces canus]MDQ0762536.1 hypothetical protein [Streptomyces canus]MDQ1069023.1 hypothetical protein [Streptomyces canus]
MRAHLARVDAVLVQALIAAALSFAHIHDIAMAAGQDGWKAWAYSISVDLLLVAAWRRLRSGTAKAAAWCWFVIALTASLGANVATAGLLDMTDVPAWLRILVAGWPAVAFLGGTLLAHSAPKAANDELGTEVMEDQEDEPEATPDPADQPTTESTPPNPPVPVPVALVDHARKVAAEHHTRTGTRIDTPTLRARLGVPAPLAEAIAAQL